MYYSALRLSTNFRYARLFGTHASGVPAGAPDSEATKSTPEAGVPPSLPARPLSDFFRPERADSI